MDARGLAPDGTIAREGALERVPATFGPVVDATRVRLAETFGPTRLHSAYLYGSIPRGTATPGISDLDLQLALHDEPTAADRADADEIESVLDRTFPQIDGAGILLNSAAELLSPQERYDGGFFLACLCTPLLGPDLAEHLPRYRPTSRLARETNGDLGRQLPTWRARAAAATTPTEQRKLNRTVARRLVRTAFTLVMPRWNGWTSDLERSAKIFAHYYPPRTPDIETTTTLAQTPTPDPTPLTTLLNNFAPWLAAEYTAAHGEKAPPA